MEVSSLAISPRRLRQKDWSGQESSCSSSPNIFAPRPSAEHHRRGHYHWNCSGWYSTRIAGPPRDIEGLAMKHRRLISRVRVSS
eukprot:648339-Pyramimonas_sp.AAC.1